ncbi:hypothetical protein C8J27_11048 [Rhodobacter aestuarii]|uniref:Uncharacterized protein n=1 Tax=Rhodobacter aestuarii TaxID=453582 RepID=A0A1N7Q0H1_9RHOB|nr:MULTISPECIES: hypothetical protein [Rhodobacter]PTV93998.1 hypothetical protein C8J27_11048 [Rhodobacter aestuarii]SIT16342.1 hypothetical protein SAMN05421580_11248 [Rhodobacter aestuarii]SOC20430.1 hypothetical protein SAMN05877809_1125 [Rhodobacter sp. JA431]
MTKTRPAAARRPRPAPPASAPLDIPAPRYTLWAALLLAILLSGFWLAAVITWQLIGILGLG